MKRSKMFLLVSCILYVNVAVSQTQSMQDFPKISWKDKLELAKNRVPDQEAKGDGKYLTLINYTYKGVIESERVKSAIIDSMLSFNAPYTVMSAPIIVADTTYTEDQCTITTARYPVFDIMTVGKATEASYLQYRDELRHIFNIVRVGWEFLETEWDYKGVKFKSIAIVTDEGVGGFFDPICYKITQGSSTTSTSITGCTSLEP